MFIHSRNNICMFTDPIEQLCFIHVFSYDPNNLRMDILTILTIRTFNLLVAIWLHSGPPTTTREAVY
jgi:hypothetical protein